MLTLEITIKTMALIGIQFGWLGPEIASIAS